MHSVFKFSPVKYKIVRLILGTVLLAAAAADLVKSPREIQLSGPALKAIMGLWGTGYLMQLVIIIKISAAVALLSNNYVRLMNLVLMPVLINIILFNLFNQNFKGVAAGIPLILLNVWLILIDTEAYQIILTRHPD